MCIRDRFVFFAWMPLIAGLVLSFFRTKGYDIVKFIGFANYREVIALSLIHI